MKLSYSKRVDTWLALLVFGMVLFGVVMVYSASVVVSYNLFDDARYFFKKQVVWAIVGLISMVVAANVDYHVWKKWAGAMLVLTFVLLISVFLFSKGEINGAHRWIVLGGQSFQPSELAKLSFIIYTSAWLVERQKSVHDIKETFLPYLGVLAAIGFLMLRQPDFGTLMIIIVSACSVYYAAGLTLKQFALGALLMVLAVGVAVGSNDYMRGRLLTFLNPSRDSSDKSYHVENIGIAIGSGGLFGRGFGESKQKLRYLPEPQTDSIYAIVAEELGFIWAQLLILAYLALVWRGYLVAAYAPDMFGKLIATGITSWFGFQAFINLGSMLHIVPLVGVPLPFLSYGGTNLIISLLAMGILLNISRFSHAQMKEQKEPKNRQPVKRPNRYA